MEQFKTHQKALEGYWVCVWNYLAWMKSSAWIDREMLSSVCKSFCSSKLLFPLLNFLFVYLKNLQGFVSFIVLIYKTFFFVLYLKRHLSINGEHCSNLASSEEESPKRFSSICFVEQEHFIKTQVRHPETDIHLVHPKRSWRDTALLLSHVIQHLCQNMIVYFFFLE